MKCPNCGHENRADAKFCDECGTALAPAEEADPRQALLEKLLPEPLREKIEASGAIEAERRPITVLFGDLSGFTALGDQLDPEALAALAEECYEAMVGAIYRYEGFVDKFMGDAVMALFGAPVAHEDDPERAVRCALEMRDAIEAIADAQGDLAAGNLTLHGGIHTGEARVGSVGPNLRLEYTALGDTVNITSRLQGLAGRGEIWTSEATQRLVAPLFDFEALPPQAVKGKKEPLAAFRLLGSKAEPESLRGIPSLASPIVGRDQELELFRQALEDLQRGTGRIVFVLGEPGIGKSRLVAEARRESDKTVTWLEGRCLSYGATIAYWPLVEILKSWAAVAEEDPDVQRARKLRLALRRLMRDRLDETFPYLATLLALKLDPASEEKVKYLDAEALQTRIHLAVRDWLEALASDTGVVLVLEDLHWGDPSTVALVESLLRATDRAPILLCLISRVEREKPWWRLKEIAEREIPHRLLSIELKALEADQTDALVRNLLSVEDLPGGAKKSILAKAEGNPFFLEEILRALIDEGVIVRQNDHWRATVKVLSLEVPDTVQGVILARLDRLPPHPRRVLQTASVIGRSFLYRILAAIDDRDGALEDHLSTLQRVDLVLERARLPELEYVFRHALTQEVAYGTLLHEKRREVHGKVGASIESMFSDRVEEFYGLLAHHYSEAEDRRKALEYLTKAGDRARSAYANQEAIEFYERAYDLLKDGTDPMERRQAADVLIALGGLHRLLAQGDESLLRFEEAASLYRSMEDRGALAGTLYQMARVYHSNLNDYSKAAEIARNGLAIAKEAGEPLTIAQGLRVLAYSLFWGGLDVAQGKEDAKKALEMFEEAQDFRGLGDVHHLLGLMADELAQSIWHSVRAAEYRLKVDKPVHASSSYNNAATQCYEAGDLDQAMEYVQKGIELAEKAGGANMYCILHTTLCETLVLLGDLQRAQEVAEQNLQLARRIGTRQLECFCEGDLFRVAFAEGDWEKAVTHSRRHADLSVYTSPFYRGMGRMEMASALISMGEARRAGKPLEEALALAEEADSLRLEGTVHREFGRLHTGLQAWDSAEQAFEESLRIWDELNDPGVERSRSLRDQGLMLLRRGQEGDEDRGRELLGVAIQFFRSKNDQFDLIWAERELAELELSLDDMENG